MISTRICEKLFAVLDVCATKSLGLCYNSSSMEKPGCKLNCLLTLSNTFVFASHEPDYHCQLGNKIWNHFYATSRFHSQGSLLQGFVIFAYIHTSMIYIYIQTYSLLATKKLYIYNIQMQEASLATSVVFSHWPMVWFTFPLGWAPTDDGFHDSNFALAVLAATSIGREKRKHGVYQHDTHV